MPNLSMEKLSAQKLSVKNLSISFRTISGDVHAVRDISFDLKKGETLAIVGESGSGKSVTTRAIMGILAGNAKVESGSIMYDGEDLLSITEEEFQNIRGKKIGMIYQDPLSSLNPIMKIGKQITEGLLLNGDHIQNRIDQICHAERTAYFSLKRELKLLDKKDKQKKQELKQKLKEVKRLLDAAELIAKTQAKEEYIADIAKLNEELRILKTNPDGLEKHEIQEKIQQKKDEIASRRCVTKKEAKARALEVMREVGIPDPEKRYNQYPFQFSGGMRQRIVIAIVLTQRPDILICDEPTTALDVTIQSQILELIEKLKAKHDLTVIFITHDLGVVANIADRIAVMYAGKIQEIGGVEDIFYNPQHPYTWAMLGSMPDLTSKDRLLTIPGTPPDMRFPPKGDAFALRSDYAMQIDMEEQPPMFKVTENHYAATWLLHPDCPKVERPVAIDERIRRMSKMYGKEGNASE
ncbi:MAG: hypothetical protein ATN31_06725 [Candidatus Epulonipiscioides saccharophilum]|nr:MAG: hypothetical protein ATN31_06725 [Epulopiscium sp. AS2M-Bin001]